MVKRALFVLMITVAAAGLAGCGLCTEETVSESGSPGGLYNAAIISSDCVGTSKSREVVLHNLGGFKDSKAVAFFDDSDGDNPADVTIRWQMDSKLIIHGHGARVWSFQPNWHDVQVEER